MENSDQSVIQVYPFSSQFQQRIRTFVHANASIGICCRRQAIRTDEDGKNGKDLPKINIFSRISKKGFCSKNKNQQHHVSHSARKKIISSYFMLCISKYKCAIIVTSVECWAGRRMNGYIDTLYNFHCYIFRLEPF